MLMILCCRNMFKGNGFKHSRDIFRKNALYDLDDTLLKHTYIILDVYK